MATLINLNVNRAIDLNGYTLPGALATFYNSGTTAVRTVYTNPEATIPHASPVVANGAGVFPPIYDAGGGDVKVEVTDANGVMLAGYPVDPVQIITTDITGASSVQFEPTADIPETDVQAAIERVQENIVAPLAEFGLGVTGNAAVLNDLDATDTASGIYRFDGTTAGTFPSGVTAADGGTVRIWRETASAALMILSPRSGTNQHLRRLDGTWAAWGYLLRSNDTANDTVWAAGASTTPYAASPSNVAAAVAAQAIGVGQVWENVIANRAFNVFLGNNTGRPIEVFIAGSGFSNWWIEKPGGAQMATGDLPDGMLSFTVPAGHRYKLDGSGLITTWWELR